MFQSGQRRLMVSGGSARGLRLATVNNGELGGSERRSNPKKRRGVGGARAKGARESSQGYSLLPTTTKTCPLLSPHPAPIRKTTLTPASASAMIPSQTPSPTPRPVAKSLSACIPLLETRPSQKLDM